MATTSLSLISAEQALLRRIRVLIVLFMIALVVSGATAIPLLWELNLMASWLPLRAEDAGTAFGALAKWIHYVRDGLSASYGQYPFLAYGTDWLAFGHFMLALVFVGPLRDPVRNLWVLNFGLIACVLVIPYAFLFGELRGIPFWWRIIDCLFGLLGFPLLWLARRDTLRLAEIGRNQSDNPTR